MPTKKKKTDEPLALESFECKAHARVWGRVDDDKVTIGLGVQVRDMNDEPIVSPTDHLSEGPEKLFTIPRKNFADEEAIKTFVRGIRDRFAAFGALLLASQGDAYLFELFQLQEAALSPHWDNVDEETVIHEHLSETEYILRLIHDAPRPGKRSKWTTTTLARAVRDALEDLKNRRRSLCTLNGVASELKKKFPDKAPPSGAALGVLLPRHKLNWDKLKEEANI